ncbi:tripartite tricarboxylate transporter substrate binding protein [Roseomonas sp. KE2513]|uniref:Bug family tripartite tricarboxylate transporter substrate binding protein n=1 Tax=Roseomonas sp. KE2513 TaxID=2479202 RepID=UPI0018DFD548|nr:tripartite tricarboxylate transporter substrate binding protein [Roseomonas sp. KE2513]
MIRKTKRSVLAFLALALATSFAAPVRAQQGLQPGGGTVRLVLNSAPGSAADAVARVMVEPLAEILGQPVVVENVPGGGGVVGIARAMQSRRDGTTILSAVSGTLIGPMLDRSLPYEIGRDLIPVSQTTAAMAVFVVRSGLEATNLRDFVARAKEGGQPLAFGNYGYGSSSHLQGMLLARETGLEVEAVPFNGTSQLITEMIGGRLCCAFIDVGSARDFIRAGQLRPLGSTGPRRAPDLPDVPTFTEQGLANFDPQIWQGMFLPAGTPPSIVEALGRALGEATRRPGPAAFIRSIGYEPVGSSPGEFAAMIAHDAPIWRQIIDQTGVRIK